MENDKYEGSGACHFSAEERPEATLHMAKVESVPKGKMLVDKAEYYLLLEENAEMKRRLARFEQEAGK
jgi:hypothetical protein